MSNPINHPAADRLEALVEGLLDQGDRVVVQSHLVGCSRCQSEVDELRALFGALARLQHFSPAAGFLNRVMARVRLPEPWYARAGDYLQRLAPRTSQGWAFASGLFALPLLGFSVITLWLLSKPYVTSEGLLAFTFNQIGSRASAVLSSAYSVILHSDVTFYLARALEPLVANGFRAAGTLAVLFASMTVLAAWVLYQNLFRNPTRGSDYVSYSF